MTSTQPQEAERLFDVALRANMALHEAYRSGRTASGDIAVLLARRDLALAAYNAYLRDAGAPDIPTLSIHGFRED